MNDLRMRAFTGLELAIVIALTGALGFSVFKVTHSNKKARETAQVNEEQAKKIAVLTNTATEQQKAAETLRSELDKTQAKLSKDVRRDISILHEQAKDVNTSSNTIMTGLHLETTSTMVGTYGYDPTAETMKWNMALIRQQQVELSKLMAERDLYLKQSLEAEAKLKTTLLSANLQAQEHEKVAMSLRNQVLAITGETSWLSLIIKYLTMGTIMVLVVMGLGWLWTHRQRKHAIEVAEKMRIWRNEAADKIATFYQVDGAGNATMDNVLGSAKEYMIAKVDSPFKKKKAA